MHADINLGQTLKDFRTLLRGLKEKLLLLLLFNKRSPVPLF